MDTIDEAAVADAALPQGEELGRLLLSVLPDTLKARFAWESGQVVQRMGADDTAVERGLAVLWLSIRYGYGTLGWAARLLGTTADRLRGEFDSHGYRGAAAV